MDKSREALARWSRMASMLAELSRPSVLVAIMLAGCNVYDWPTDDGGLSPDANAARDARPDLSRTDSSCSVIGRDAAGRDSMGARAARPANPAAVARTPTTAAVARQVRVVAAAGRQARTMAAVGRRASALPVVQATQPAAQRVMRRLMRAAATREGQLANPTAAARRVETLPSRETAASWICVPLTP
jgi:hypothetical protein